MKTNLFILLITLVFLTSCESSKTQKKRIEIGLMNCMYNAYLEVGVDFKTTINDYEALLINESILKDSKGKSYKIILEKITEDRVFKVKPSKLFIEIMSSAKPMDINEYSNCQIKLFNDSINYDGSKFDKLQKMIEKWTVAPDMQPSLIASDILAILEDKDFELDFYKFRTFLLFDSLKYK